MGECFLYRHIYIYAKEKLNSSSGGLASIHKVGIQEVVIHVKAQVRIDHAGLVVGRRHHPAVRSPGVRHLLVPAVVELEASQGLEILKATGDILRK